MRFLLPALALFLLPLRSFALDAGVSYAVYQAAGRPYVEVNLEIAALSLYFEKIDSLKGQNKAEVLVLITRGDTVVNYDKYLLIGPELAEPKNLIDVRRLAVPFGSFNLEVSVTDVYKPDNTWVFTKTIQVEFGPGIYLTEIQLLRNFVPDSSGRSFVKNNFFLDPLPFNFYDRNAVNLSFYAEVYQAANTITDGSYLVRYFIERELGNGKRTVVSTGFQRRTVKPVDVLMAQLDISKLESGNYLLTVEIRDNANVLLARRLINFQRSNPYLNIAENEITQEVVEQQFVQELDTAKLTYVIRTLLPLSGGDESQILVNLLKSRDVKGMRFFVFRHFVRIDANNPEQAYNDHLALAARVNKEFYSGFRYGFETDRGRIYMRYGKPDDLVRVENEPSAPPYEIWVYYNFPKTKQNNVKFLFYNPSLAGEDFILLHSNARGEINNPRWERDLYKRNAGEEYDGDNYNDAMQMRRNVNRNARVYFEDF